MNRQTGKLRSVWRELLPLRSPESRRDVGPALWPSSTWTTRSLQKLPPFGPLPKQRHIKTKETFLKRPSLGPTGIRQVTNLIDISLLTLNQTSPRQCSSVPESAEDLLCTFLWSVLGDHEHLDRVLTSAQDGDVCEWCLYKSKLSQQSRLVIFLCLKNDYLKSWVDNSVISSASRLLTTHIL